MKLKTRKKDRIRKGGGGVTTIAEVAVTYCCRLVGHDFVLDRERHVLFCSISGKNGDQCRPSECYWLLIETLDRAACSALQNNNLCYM